MIETAINLDIQSEKTDNKPADTMTVERGETDTNSPPPPAPLKTSPKKSPKSPKSAKSSPKSPRSLSSSSIASELDAGTLGTVKPDEQTSSSLLLPIGQIRSGQLFGPFTDPIQWLTVRHSNAKHGLPKELVSLEPDLLRLFRSIQMANSAEEQNLEIIVKNNKFYFRATQAIDLDGKVGATETIDDGVESDGHKKKSSEDEPDSPLFAWFSAELSARLPTPAVNVINGNKRYYCTKCNSVFIFPNPTILHILFACSSSYPGNAPLTSPPSSERLASPSGRSENNNEPSLSIGAQPDNAGTGSASSTTSKTVPSPAPIAVSSSPAAVAEPVSYTPLNGSVSLANSKILKNLEAKLCKQFNSSISNETASATSAATSRAPSSATSKPSKPTKKRAFDIDSLVNNVEQTSNKKSRSVGGHHAESASDNKKSAKNEKIFKTPLSTASTKPNTDHLTNSTLINSLNSPLASATSNGLNSLSSSFLNPFSFLDPTALAASLPSAFHKIDNVPAANSSMSSSINKSLLGSSGGGSSLADQSSLLNAAAMFGNVPNFANPFDLAAIYAQQQRNLLQSMFGQSVGQSGAGQLSAGGGGSSAAASSQSTNLNSNLSNLNYLQSQLTNPLFASQSLASLGGLNSLNSLSNFNSGLNSLLANQPSSSGGSSLQNSLANSLFAGLSGASPASLNSFNPMGMPSSFSSSAGLLDPFTAPQSMPTEKSSSASKKKKSKEPATSPTNSLKSSGGHTANSLAHHLGNGSNRNSSGSSSSLSSSLSSLLPPTDSSSASKLNSLLHPSYFQFLSPSLAALSSPQSNWCAKCNISFRMTSDLVYHMRSAHKEGQSNGSESASPTKRKQENKLFCQICGEGFKGTVCLEIGPFSNSFFFPF